MEEQGGSSGNRKEVSWEEQVASICYSRAERADVECVCFEPLLGLSEAKMSLSYH